MSSLLIRGGHVVDPTHGIDAVQDLYVLDGRIVGAMPEVDETIDAAGGVVMAGGIDMHTHIGGGKANLSRLLLPEDHRGLPLRAASAIELASCGTCSPGTLATGYRYVEMGYTAAFEPAMMAANARHTHMEMGDTPVLDHGAYVMLGNDELFLEMLARQEDFQTIRDYAGWQINAAKAMGVKVVNPAGISAFKFNQRKLDVDEQHVHWQVTPRQVVQTLARALKELGVPHPLHIHGSNLGVAGNIESTLQTIQALEGLPAHLTHIQFHSYGREGPKKFSSAALQLAEAVNANPNISIDVGQIMFGQTVTASGDTMRQHAQSGFATPRKWVGADYELEAGCGVVPFKYREQSYVNALQWAIGLEIFLLVNDPWRVVLTTDHPNGGPFTSYPHLIKLLMSRSFREEQLSKLHPDVAAQSALKSITRELTLSEIAIMTRAAPAKLLGLKDRGHLGVGGAADIVVYRRDADAEAMFRTPSHVFKDGAEVARDGRLTAAPVGGTHFVEPDYDHGIHKRLRRHFSDKGLVNFDHVAIGRDEAAVEQQGHRTPAIDAWVQVVPVLEGPLPADGVFPGPGVMIRNGVTIDETFAEAFPMKATRILITAHNLTWARHAAVSATGFATSVIACGCEAGIERELSAEETPDGRPGVAILLFAMSGKELGKQIERRMGQCVLTCPTTAMYAGIHEGEAVALGKNLRFFGDGWQISKLIDGIRYWRVPVMDGEFVAQETTAITKAVGGGNLLLLARDTDAALAASEAAVAAMKRVPNVVMPFPGGVVRSGSKVGSKYPALMASTNDAFCPTLFGIAPETQLTAETACVMEIVIDGLTEADVSAAMRAGLDAGIALGSASGLLRISAGNYGGKLGPFHFHLHKLMGAAS